MGSVGRGPGRIGIGGSGLEAAGTSGSRGWLFVRPRPEHVVFGGGGAYKSDELLPPPVGCAYEDSEMPGELVHQVVETCACVLWPEGRAGELEGVVRLLGGGIMKLRVST